MSTANRYPHFCALAQVLERVGERWTLLIIRDLLRDGMRFSELLRSCAGITPRQLSHRLRQLEADGMIERHRIDGRRETRYELTSLGRSLQPVVETMMVWGVTHLEAPRADEPVLASHAMTGTRVALEHLAPRPDGPVKWTWRFPVEWHTLEFDGDHWTQSRGDMSESDVIVETSPAAWAQFTSSRGRARSGIRVLTTSAARRDFLRAFPRLVRNVTLTDPARL